MSGDVSEAMAVVSRLPIHNGDGYSYGGDVILTIGTRSISFGSECEAQILADEMARRWNSARALDREGR